jgi:hypothetical protein
MIHIGNTYETADATGAMVTHGIYETGGEATLVDSVTGNIDIVIGTRGFDGVRDVLGRAIHQTPADLLMHAMLVHAIPSITGADMNRGLENENELRRERGMLQRGPDSDHPVLP